MAIVEKQRRSLMGRLYISGLTAVVMTSVGVSQGRAAPQPSAAVAKANAPDIYYGDPGSPNIGGLWRPTLGRPTVYYVDGKPIKPMDPVTNLQAELPYKPAWMAAYVARLDSRAKGNGYGEPTAQCWPQGIFGNYVGSPNAIKITQTPGRIEMIFERLTQLRWIYTDGRPHPTGAALVPTSEGHSIGHWEGDVLVADTIGVRREFTLSFFRPHSDQVHFTERFKKIDPVTLQIDVTIDDPKAFEKPLEARLFYTRQPNTAEMDEDFCTENNREWPDKNLIEQLDISAHKHYGFDLPD